MSNSFDTFKDLPESLQKEAIREGEKLLDTQFLAATAADQRALTWGGFLIAAATGALGGGLVLLNKSQPDLLVGYAAMVFATAILRAAWLAIATVEPSLFGFPGNSPVNWLPSSWGCTGSENNKIEVARTEQATHLDTLIRENREQAASNAKGMKRSFKWAVRSLIFAGAVLFAVVTYRQFDIQDLKARWISLTYRTENKN